MNPQLLASIIVITCALIFYTIGVWSEHHAKTLKPWHAVMFVLGLTCDASGTYIMTRIAQAEQSIGNPTLNTIMAWTGTIALCLMAFHAIWAIVVLVRGRESELHAFHRFSITVWAIWLIPYIVGALAPML
jgi:uncharacterized repeat protein (TIGR03987 family)